MTASNLEPEGTYVAGLPVMRADVERALDLLWADAAVLRPVVYVFVNAYSATLRRSAGYRAAIFLPDVAPLPDGAALTLGALLTGQGRIGRCPGPDLLEAAAYRAARDGTTFFLLGGGEGIASALAESLRQRHPNLVIAGVATPPYGEWPDEESARLAEAASVADIVWLGVSAPKQEVWAVRWSGTIGRPVVCVGAAFDFLCGNKPRAPRWMRAVGLEWLFRLASEPGRLWKRYLVGNAAFLWDLVRWGRRPAQ